MIGRDAARVGYRAESLDHYNMPVLQLCSAEGVVISL